MNREDRVRAAAAAVARAQVAFDHANALRIRYPIPSYRRAFEDATQALADSSLALVQAELDIDPQPEKETTK